MCWTSRNMPIMKVAKESITVFKVVRCKYGIIESLIYNFKYKLGNQYKIENNLLIEGQTINCDEQRFSIEEGYHSYKEESLPHTKDSFSICPLLLYDFEISIKYGISLMKCEIPIGSTYYENNSGEVVSDTIIPEGIYPTWKIKEMKETNIDFTNLSYTDKLISIELNRVYYCIKILFFKITNVIVWKKGK